MLKEKKKEYQDWYDKNSDPYGRACLTFVERWVELLEEQINKSDNVMQCILIMHINAVMKQIQKV